MIQISNVCKRFENKILLEKFNLNIEDGEFVVFAGKSGCGKTTLLNMIGGLEEPDQGKIIVDGLDLYRKKRKEAYFTYKVGFLFQNFALLETKTVRQNIEMVKKKARNQKTVEEVLENVNLLDKIDTPVYKLSGGEQQRVALARLMFKKCDIILADEPTGSLDIENTKNVLSILHRMNQEGKTIILVTHDENIIKEESRVIKL